MAIFEVYTYHFAPVQVGSLFKTFSAEELKNNFEHKQDIFGKFFEKDFNLIFRREGVSGDIVKHLLLGNRYGIIVLRIANEKKQKHEKDFVRIAIDNEPSCLVVIDNRKDRQQIAIQRYKDSFATTKQVAQIMEKTFNGLLSDYGLSVEIGARYHTHEFWEVIDNSQKGVTMVKFSFPYPNLPWVSENVEEFFNDIASETESEPDLQLNAVEGKTLKINKQSRIINSSIQACSASGKPIVIRSKEGTVFYCGKNGSIELEINDYAFEKGPSKDIFDSGMKLIVKGMNQIKQRYD